MSNPDNTRLKEVYEHIVQKHGSFPLNKTEYEPFINDVLTETAATNESKSDLESL